MFLTQYFHALPKPFILNNTFLYTLKTSKNFTGFWLFQVVERCSTENNWVKLKTELKNLEQ